MSKCTTIAITNQKGGVGKTTTTVNIGISLAREGKKVLLIDLDSQGNLTSCLGWKDPNSLDYTLSEVFVQTLKDESPNFERAILKHDEGVDLLPCNESLADVEMRLVSVLYREKTLLNSIESLKERYDYILFDCPPSLGMMTINALTASDEVIIPVQTHYLSAIGMTNLIANINLVKRHINPSLKIAGIVFTMVEENTNVAKSTIESVQEGFGRNVNIYKTAIPKAIKLSEASIFGKSIFTYAKRDKAAAAYLQLGNEILNQYREQ